MSPIDWLPWDRAAFARARAEKKPVLLSLSAAWCHWCHEMDRTSYADPAVAAMVNERFVPVRVDADRRPDLHERYNLGGLPTLAFLTADGDVVGGGTFVPADRMRGILDQVLHAFGSRGSEMEARARTPAVRPAAATTETIEPGALIAQVDGAFDVEHGGFGIEPKFPLVAPLELTLIRLRETPDDARLSHMATLTLDAMGWRGLYDEVDGGFFRYAATRDWQLPHEEKLLDVNAALLGAYVLGFEVLGAHRYAERAHDALRYVQTWLADQVDGGWFGSQQADHAYYAARSPESRAGMTAPATDGVLYASWNAAMVSAALRAAHVFADTSLAEFAILSLERVVLACYSPGAGVSHYFDGEPRVRGLLEDQFAMAAAHLEAHEATGNVVYEMMAEELAHFALRTMWDEEEGGLFDRAVPEEGESIGRLRQRLKPFAANCDAARVLFRLARTSGEREFAARARAILDAMAGPAAGQGPLAAHYLLALHEARIR